jgi:hypothetical protein
MPENSCPALCNIESKFYTFEQLNFRLLISLDARENLFFADLNEELMRKMNQFLFLGIFGHFLPR